MVKEMVVLLLLLFFTHSRHTQTASYLTKTKVTYFLTHSTSSAGKRFMRETRRKIVMVSLDKALGGG